MKTYLISVVCSDATTFSQKRNFRTKKEAECFCDGVCAVFEEDGKKIYIRNVELTKIY